MFLIQQKTFSTQSLFGISKIISNYLPILVQVLCNAFVLGLPKKLNNYCLLRKCFLFNLQRCSNNFDPYCKARRFFIFAQTFIQNNKVHRFIIILTNFYIFVILFSKYVINYYGTSIVNHPLNSLYTTVSWRWIYTILYEYAPAAYRFLPYLHFHNLAQSANKKVKLTFKQKLNYSLMSSFNFCLAPKKFWTSVRYRMHAEARNMNFTTVKSKCLCGHSPNFTRKTLQPQCPRENVDGL